MTTPVRDTLVDATTGPAHRPGVEEAEHRANIRRLRWVMPMATLIWVGFIPVDYLMASRIEPGPFEVYFGLRMLGAGAHFVVDALSDINGVLDEIGERLKRGERP